MRILQLTNKPIFPLVDGGCVAMNQLAKLLERNEFDVKNLSIETEKHPFHLDAFPADFRLKFNPEALKIDLKVSIFGALKSILKNESYNISRFKNEKFGQRLIEILRTSEVDLVICESIFLLPYLNLIRENSKAKIVVRAHNVEFKIWERLAANATFPKSLYLNYLSKKLKKEEIPLLQKCDAILCISQEDEQQLKALNVNVPMTTIPVFMNESAQHVDFTSSKFHHLGSMNWQPNVEAVNELIDHIFPKIKAEIPDAELHLGGSFFPDTIKSNPAVGIFVHGFVEDKFEFINTNGIQLIPLKSGSGVRVKILESLAIGAPIVTTEIGVEGIDVTNGKELFIAENDSDFVEKAIRLNKNADLRRQIGTNARNLMLKEYGFEKVNTTFIEFIRTIS